jgi:O-antigen biosynthesis protein
MTSAVPILLYHSVSTDTTPKYETWTTTPETFAMHMRYLHEKQYTPMTVTQFAAAIADRTTHLPERPVVISFDDGLADFYTGALPILESYRFTATLYITTGMVGHTSTWLTSVGEGSRPMLSWSRIAEIQTAGVECGAHGLTHQALDILSRSEARNEIICCKNQLEQHLGRAIKTFAYPHGYYSPVVRRIVEEAGYSSACAVKHAMSASTDDRFALARIMVTGPAHRDIETFGRLLAGEGLPVAPTKRRLGTRGWRLGRRVTTLLKRRSYSPV